MQIALDIGIIFLAYIFGSIPFGLLIVKLKTGKDIREVESGRTGGTNAMRAAGFWAGFATAMLDILKGAVAVWVAQQWLTPRSLGTRGCAHLPQSLDIIIPFFLSERDENGKLIRLRGGAGGATFRWRRHGIMACLDLDHSAARHVDLLHHWHRIHHHDGSGIICHYRFCHSRLTGTDALDRCMVWRGRGNFTDLGITSQPQKIIRGE